MSWLDIDWKQERPPPTVSVQLWRAVEVERIDRITEPVAVLVAELRRLFSNGGAAFARFHVEGDADFDWFAARNRWQEIDFCQRLLLHPVVAAELGEVTRGADFDKITFDWGSPLTLDGELARALVFGGAYDKFAGSAREAKALGAQVCAALFDERYADVEVFRSWGAWSRWFHGIAWDSTFIVIDRRQQVVSVLAWTDTD